MDEPVWLCLLRGAPPTAIELTQIGDPLAGETLKEPDRLHLTLEWSSVGPVRVRDGAESLPAGTYVLAAEGFEPETLRVREATPAERRDYALLRRARYHLDAGDSVRAARLLRDFLAQSSNPSAIVAARLELLSVLPYTEYAERPKLWLAEWVARHHQNCVVGVGIERWLPVVTPEEGQAALRELASAYVGTRASVFSQAFLRHSSARANE